MGLSNAERQRRHRERLKAGQPPSRMRYRLPKDKRPRARRWSDAVQELADLQAEYQAWLDSLPENLRLRQWPSIWRLSATWIWTPCRTSSRREDLAATKPEAFSVEKS